MGCNNPRRPIGIRWYALCIERAVAYLRVSTQQQQRSGLGIEAQRAAIERFAAAESLLITAEYSEFETGKGADALDRRPQLAAALAAARKAKCSIVVSRSWIGFPAMLRLSRAHGAKGAVHCCRARSRRRSVHAAPIRGLGGEGTAADLGANIGGAAGNEGERGKVGQPDEPLSCGLDRTHCERSQRSRCPTNSGQRMGPVFRQESTGSY
jgi:Resolvase, N terminal domain